MSLVAGATGDFDTAPAAGPVSLGLDGYVVRAGANLGVESVTFLGGEASDGLTGLTVDPLGRIAFVGYSGSDRLPFDAGFQPMRAGGLDALVGQLSEDGQTLVAGSYFGGKEDDAALAVDALPGGPLAVVGWTRSKDLFPVSRATPPGGKQDGFLAGFKDLASAPSSGRYIGGGGDDLATSVAAMPDATYVGGVTGSEDFGSQTGATGSLQESMQNRGS